VSFPLEVQKNRADFRGTILALAGGVFPEFLFSISEGKFDRFSADGMASDSGSVSALVEDSAKIVGNVKEDASECIRRFVFEPDFVDMLGRIRVFIDHVGPRVTVFEFRHDPFEIGDVMMCSCESEPGAMERSSHGRKLRSDKRP
jgi:hypothetical protein